MTNPPDPHLPSQPLLQNPSAPQDYKIVSDIVQAISSAVVQSNVTEEQEITRRHAEDQQTYRMGLRYGFWITVFVLGIAVAALLRDKDQIVTAIISTAVGFAGGYGFGRSRKPPNGS